MAKKYLIALRDFDVSLIEGALRWLFRLNSDKKDQFANPDNQRKTMTSE